MSWFNKRKAPKKPIGTRTVKTEGLWEKCEQCKQTIWKKDLESTYNVCPNCNFHFKIKANERFNLLFDHGTYIEYDRDLQSNDPLQFVDKKPYKTRLSDMLLATGMKDAIMVGEGKLSDKVVCICAMEPGFISGSMGVVVGEKITRAIRSGFREATD